MRLDEDGRMVDGYLSTPGSERPTLRTWWLWLRQGRPRDYPVITREGAITARVSAIQPDGQPLINAEDVTVRGWSFDHSLMPPGMMSVEDLFRGLFTRRQSTLVYPDGHTEMSWLSSED